MTKLCIKTLLVVLTWLGLAACQESPTGRDQLALLPDTVMADMGRKAFAELKRSQPLVTDPGINAAVQCIAGKVIAAARDEFPPELMPDDWEVAVFLNPAPNAFALPGGKIGVNTGMLEVAASPAQLAAVIGHEVGHVLADHGNERMTQQLGIESVLYVVGFLSEGEMGQQQLLQALGIGSQLGISLPFSRAHEREADVMGLGLMAAAGFEPDQSVQLWRNMAALGGGQPPEFLSTHPANESRIKLLEAGMAPARELYRAVSPANCPPVVL
ncbi:M48 family metallopeptidase [Hydrocarboniclastica marina]|uniref:M48 family peptidase n=1 Tax=Hydrocarboniclastica marina TaxID=2259620 RepID=A0A4P7XL59_9ALTE|nr:M48 family metallopeptidase [Hydrocarboniclastica marina]QCF27112.1 M48 family peptidase [Hydrocarboniclastica marina]